MDEDSIDPDDDDERVLGYGQIRSSIIMQYYYYSTK